MADETPKNIFEAARLGKKGPQEAPPPKKPLLTPEQIEEMIKKTWQERDALEKQLDEFYRKSGYTPERVAKILDNPANFTPHQKRILDEAQKKLDNLSLSKRKGKGGIQEEKKKKEADANVERKGKTLGGRKGWISM